MASNVVSVIVGVIIGLLLMGLAVWVCMPAMMLNKHKSKRGYDETLKFLTVGLQKKQDWHQVNMTDYQESTAAFGSIERVCSMSVCNLRYAAKILAEDINRGVTAFMPLAIGIYDK